jgi:hypothetical protein
VSRRDSTLTGDRYLGLEQLTKDSFTEDGWFKTFKPWHFVMNFMPI